MTGDLISRELALERLKGVISRTGMYGVSIEVVLGAIPAVEAEPVVHAHWAKRIENGLYWYECSACDGEVPKTRYKTDLFSDYCPHCGAYMDEEVADGT